MKANSLNKWIGKIHNVDCVEGMKNLPAESVQLVFADPPFNIGYDYDEYDDRLESEKYLEWTHRWISEVYSVLDPAGAFWLAIGDEYAAELKLAAQKIGFKTRNWVVWYYTFGVHCKAKFTRSHAHLFYFVKDSKQLSFNFSAIAVPSARQLVYGDSRANPAGRSPDDTWILRPQDCVDGFTPDEDTWYFPRVAGTFKERAGFHGCQMPEQLLGRIIRACSHPDDVVLDPFSGSGTTVTVARKLGRRFLSFELSKQYVQLGRKRLDNALVGDPLEGAEEPNVSAPATAGIRNGTSSTSRGLKNKKIVADLDGFPNNPSSVFTESNGIVEAFSNANRGYSVDRLIADPVLNEDFQTQCDRLSIPGTPVERNRFLFRLRKSGRLKGSGIETSHRTSIDWEELESFVFASEIAWRHISDLYAGLGLDEILCDPRIAAIFDEKASAYSPGFSPLQYRWAALTLRKACGHVKRRARTMVLTELEIRKFLVSDMTLLGDLDTRKFEHGPAIYGLKRPKGGFLYVGETSDIHRRLVAQFGQTVLNTWPRVVGDSWALELFVKDVSSVSDYRLVRQSKLSTWYKPEWNTKRLLVA